VKFRRLPELAFTYYPSGFVDNSSGLETGPFVEEGHPGRPEGRLPGGTSQKFFGRDYIAAAAAYDIAALDQQTT